MVKKSRKGPRFFHGDDLTKVAQDRKRRSKTEPWENLPAGRQGKKRSK